MDNNNLPFLLRHCFKDVKKEADHESNISAICKKCSKTLKGSLNATTNFLNHIKRKGHGDLLKEYEELKPHHTKKRKCGVAESDNNSNTASTPKKMKQSTLTKSLRNKIMDNPNLPFILRHCFKVVKKEADHESNISAICKKCSKTLKGSLNSTTNFLNHIKRKGHGDLLKEYEELKPHHTKKRKCGIAESDNNSNTASTAKKMKQSTLTQSLRNKIMDNNNLPFLLRHCFKDVKKEADHESNISAICKKCSKTLKGSLNSTTNFLNHIKRKGHGDLLKEYEELKPHHTKKRKCRVAESDNNSNIASTAKKMKQSTPTKSLPKSIHLDKLIVNFIVYTMSPMSIVENKSFRALIEGAQQLSIPPKVMCRRTCNNKIADLYTEYKGNLKNKLKAVQYVCTTADIWSSLRRSYLGMTAHWIDPDTFARNSSSLACRRIKGFHTFDKIAELIIEIHEEYDLKLSKITKTVTDNGSNMVKAFKIIGKPDLETDTSGGPLLNVNLENFEVNINHENLDNNNQQDDDDNDDILVLNEFPESQENDLYQLPNHERCATHTLHLIPLRDIDKARCKNNSYRKLHDAAMAKCQAVWNLCTRSPKASEIYLEVTGKSPTSPSPTRWNSYYNCITDILTVQETINEALRKLGLAVLKEIEIQFLVEYTKTSKPIAEAIRSLEGDNEAYYGCLQPELIRMQKILASLEMDNPVYCGMLIEIIKESVQNRFEKYNLEDPRSKDSILAAVSYPFFKLKWVPKNKKEQVKELFITEVRKMKNDNLKNGPQSQTSERKNEKSESYYMFQDSDSSATSEGGCANTTVDLETLHYLTDECTSLAILNAYPTIKKVFLKYNTCLPSSAPVERLFSNNGMIMRPHRRTISDDVFEQLILLKSVINKEN